MFKKFIFLFCAYFVVNAGPSTPKPDPNSRPLPSPDALLCIGELEGNGFLDKCRNQSMTTWDPLKRGQQMGSVREMCCEMYGEIDCLMNVTDNSQHCNGTKQAMLNHQRTLVGWLKRTTCSTIKYHDGQCDPDQINHFLPPMPAPVDRCYKSIYQKINHCESQARKDWKIKPTDSPLSRSVCCSRYQINDCYVAAAKNLCTNTQFIQFNQYYNDVNKIISKTNCTENQYQSFNCFNPGSAFPPPPPPAALRCTYKIADKLAVCSNRAGDQWNDTLAVLKGRNACCGNWDVSDCLLTEAQDKCDLLELSEFEQYYNFLSQTITKINCTNFGYHSKACKSAIRSPTKEVSNCLHKINVNDCQNKVSKIKWKIHGMNSTDTQSMKSCCHQLSINKCYEMNALDKCNVTELSLFRKYLTDATATMCGQNQISLKECQSSATALQMSLFLTLITLFLVIKINKN